MTFFDRLRLRKHCFLSLFGASVHKGFNKHTGTYNHISNIALFSLFLFCGTMYLQKVKDNKREKSCDISRFSACRLILSNLIVFFSDLKLSLRMLANGASFGRLVALVNITVN